jgi:hypothetical protein
VISQEHPHEGEIALRDLYPTLTEEELKEAEENLRRYVQVAREILEERDEKFSHLT